MRRRVIEEHRHGTVEFMLTPATEEYVQRMERALDKIWEIATEWDADGKDSKQRAARALETNWGQRTMAIKAWDDSDRQRDQDLVIGAIRYREEQL